MRALKFALCVFICAASAFGQAASTITGIVADPTGAVLGNAAIEVRNVDNGQLYRVASTPTGNYTVAQLPPGRYEVTVDVAGFKKFNRQNISLAAAQVLRLDVSLEVGASTETVTVTAESTLLKTESGDLAHNVTLDQLQSLPLLGTGNANSGSSGIRNPYNAVVTVPGVIYSANSQMIVNGAPNNSAAYRLEGLDNTNHTVAFAVQESQPSADAVQEIAVQTSNYAAEFGAAGGGLINVVMKSGTNQFHGGLFEYFVNEDLNASRPFSITKEGFKFKDRNRRNDFGGTLGGPIWIPKVYDGRNRTFFFWSYEQFKESSLLSPGQTLPTNAFRNGDFSAISVNGGAGFNSGLGVTTSALPSADGLGRQIFANTIYDPATRAVNPVNGIGYANPFPGNIIGASRFDPTAVKIQGLLPAVQNANFTNNAAYTDISDRYTPLPSLKLDHSVGSRGKLSFYWSTTRTTSQYSLPNGNADGLSSTPILTQARGTFIYSLTERLNYDHTLTPTTLMHLGAGYSRISFYDGGPVQDFSCATISLINCQASIYFPRLITGVVGSVGGMQSLGNAQAHTLTITQRPSFNANVSSIHGSHTVKVGGEVWFQGNNTNPPSGITLNYGVNATSLPQGGLNLGGSQIGFQYASFLLGDVSSAAQGAPRGVRMGSSQWGFFAQDTWKVNRKLTLDIGLRWDYAQGARETYGRSANFSPTAINPSAGGHPGDFIYEATCNCTFVNNYKFGIGPRIGMAYQINSKTVLRGGWAFAYAPGVDIGISAANNFTNSPAGTNAFFNIQDPTTIPRPLWPNFNPGLFPLIVNGVGTTNNALASLDRNVSRPPRQNQFSLGIQREFSRNLVVEASYVGSRGVWWSGPLGLLNQVNPAVFASLPGGFNPYGNAADNTLLNTQINTGAITARFGTLTPYSGYPTNSTLLNTLRPFPQFGSAFGFGPTNSPTGKTWYDALQTGVTQRFSHGLAVTSSFTWSRSFNFTRQEFYNPNSSTKQLQGTDRPLVFNININYTTQRSEFLSKLKGANWVWQDWLVTWSSTYQSGALLNPPNATTTNFLGGPSQMFRVPGVPLFLKDLNCHCLNPFQDQFLNPLAWTNPTTTGAPDYTTNNSGGSINGIYGPSTSYSDFRGQRRPIESFNIGRNFRIKERMNLQIRAEFTNVLNRVFIGDPNTNTSPRVAIGKNQAGQITSGFGTVNATSTVGGFPALAGNASLPRQGTLIGRFTF